MRPIDADVLLEKYYSLHPYCGHCDGYGYVSIETVADLIKDAPTIEGKFVKHGQWIYRGRTVDGDNIILGCPLCGYDRVQQSLKPIDNYCPMCGAELDYPEGSCR